MDAMCGEGRDAEHAGMGKLNYNNWSPVERVQVLPRGERRLRDDRCTTKRAGGVHATHAVGMRRK